MNYYIRGHQDDDDPEYHIGKIVPGGLYCWDCGLTLCKDGAANVLRSTRWHETCPWCGQGYVPTENEEHVGVKPCGCFVMAMSISAVAKRFHDGAGATCPCCGQRYGDPRYRVVDELGRLYTPEEFFAEVNNCPIRLSFRIGTDFS